MPRDIRITHFISRTSKVAVELQRLHFSSCLPPSESWGPALNAVLYPDHLEVCVDLAGVSRETVEASVDKGQLRLRGVRRVLDSKCSTPFGCRVLTMEIEEGPFERSLSLPGGIEFDTANMLVRQANGLLWIELPVHPCAPQQDHLA